MIGLLKGKVLVKNLTGIVLLVNEGIGYEMQMPLLDLEKVYLETEYLIYTHLAVREDGWFLYGFLQEKTRNLFKELIKVSGVGAKIALAILSVMSDEEVLQSILTENITNLSRVNGIGIKMAKRLVMELKDRLAKFEFAVENHSLDDLTDAISALISLGYSSNVARKMLEPFKGQHLPSAVLIKKALQGVK